jgi:hypothetical protein
VILKDDVMPLLLQACPSFRGPWSLYQCDPSYEAGFLYVDLGEYARHVVHLGKAGGVAELDAVFAAIERLHIDGDEYVKEAATVGLLEAIQNAAAHAGLPSALLVPHLGPISAAWWRELEKFWSGNTPFR